ncbi:ATP-binding protein [Roseovarius sp. D0-M9]|uniref:ATP-binding protein n=1 Tax=Roseovarius sp. D0-M9 TaxID=3127117 RepID=UPI0030104586
MKNLDPLAILKTMHQPLVVLDRNLVVKGANRAFYQTFKVEPDETEGVAIYDLGNGQWDIPKLHDLLTDILPNNGSVDDFMVEHNFESIGRRIMKINAREIPEQDPDVILLAINDVTQQEDLRSELEWQKKLAEETIDASPVPFLVLGEDLRVQRANDTFYKTFKVDREETIGRLVFELGNNQWDIPKLRELLEDVLPENHTVHDFAVEHDFEDIGHRVMVLNARRIDHLQLILLAIDLTAHRVLERTQIEEADRRSFILDLLDQLRGEKDPEALVDVTCAAIGQRLGADQVVYVDIGESDRDRTLPHLWSNGRTPTASPGIEDFGRPFLDMLRQGQTIVIEDMQLDARAEPARSLASLEETPATGLVYAPLLEDGQMSAFLGVHFFKPHRWPPADVKLVEEVAERLRDALARCRTETELRASEERFFLLTKATNDVIWDWDIIADTYWCNENLQLMLGYDAAQMEPDPEFWESGIHPEDKERVVHGLYAAIEGSASTWAEEYRFLHADGHALTVVDRTFIIRNAEGKAVRMLGSMVNVTADRDMENRLRQAQKLEAVGQMTGGVAHDFNNLLTVILGNADMLTEDLGDRQDLRRLAEMITTTAERGAELINRLLAFSRTQMLAPSLVDVNALLNGIEGMLRRTLPKNIDIAFNRTGRRWKTEVDSSQLESAILNLTLNARDAMPEGGILTIEIANAELDEDDAAREQDVAPGQYVMLAVTDTGEGIPPDVMARIFEPFFTTKGVGGGSGLGLSMVYGFVKQSGGHIQIVSEPGKGTKVKLYFPRSPALEVPADVPEKKNKVVGGAEAILVVEDDTMVREYLINQLKGLGYRVVGAASGPIAMDLLKQAQQFDLLLTDIMLPDGMNGHQLAETIRKMRPEMKVLFTSGYTEKAIVDCGRLDANVEFLSKPYRRAQLAAKVRKVLDSR